MLEAKAQAVRYVRHLPDSEPTPLFLIVCDVGHSFELFADFTQKGRAYLPFPDARSHRVLLTDLRSDKLRARPRAIWLDPASLDPARASAEVTRQAARHLAELAKTFEADGHDPRQVAAFLTRCLFCMFAEDVGLLPKDGFRQLLDSLRPTPHGVAATLENLFRELNTGTPFSTVLRVKILHFNGGLFSDSTAVSVNATQLGLLIKADGLQWRDVEPAIFGTLLERALDPAERHKLGAHYTPRSYVERLVLPTVIEPLRDEWSNVLASAISLAEAGRTARAQELIFKFHRRLCSLRVLDPACGSGNFLYVTLAHFKILEGEVLDAYERFGGGRRTERDPRGIGAETVDPHQFLASSSTPAPLRKLPAKSAGCAPSSKPPPIPPLASLLRRPKNPESLTIPARANLAVKPPGPRNAPPKSKPSPPRSPPPRARSPPPNSPPLSPAPKRKPSLKSSPPSSLSVAPSAAKNATPSSQADVPC